MIVPGEKKRVFKAGLPCKPSVIDTLFLVLGSALHLNPLKILPAHCSQSLIIKKNAQMQLKQNDKKLNLELLKKKC